MKAFVFDPLWESLVDDSIINKLEDADIKIVLTQDIVPLSECRELFNGNEERVLCINPDYVGWKLASDDYKDIPNLKAILVASTGYEWVNPDAAKKTNTPICNIKNFSTQSVAEWAVTMMMNLARQTPRLIKDGFPLDFDKDFMKYRGQQLKGKTVGIIGLGHIGSAIAERCEGLGMTVTYWSKSSTNKAYKKVSLDELMSSSDFIFPTVAKNKETVKLITDEHIKSVKKTSVIVDIAHGILNDKLILQRIKDGQLFGYGFEAKPGSFNTYEGNVWAAPAYAWVTYESMYNNVVKWTDNMVSAAKGEFPNKVN